MIERTGAAFEEGVELTVMGGLLRPGDPAPAFTLDSLEPGGSGIGTVHLADSAGNVRLLNVINSLDTPVCHLETHRWDSARQAWPAGALIYTVSMDLPYAQARWRESEGVSHTMLSAHKDEAFGRDYGVLIKEWRLLQRAVFVIDRDDHIVYAEYVADQMREPDYAAATDAVRQALG